MNILPIVSSSSGNCTYISTKTIHILIDAGTSIKNVIAKTGRDKFDAVFVTHAHIDHVSSLGPIARKFKCQIYMHPIVKNELINKLKNCDIKDMLPSSHITVGDLEISPFSTKHDSSYTYGFIIKDLHSNKKICYITDTGIITPLMIKYMTNADAFFIETDYDVQMLKDYPDYPDYLKDRIASSHGHLSIDAAMNGLKKVGIDKTSFIIFGHLSKHTNKRELVLKAAHKKFPNYKGNFYVAPFNVILKL